MHKIRKAVFPVAGLGTRFLPATKALPKEMLSIVDKPLIQYAVEEAVASGITELIFVSSMGKHAIEDHFDTNAALEAVLADRGQLDQLSAIQHIIPDGVHCIYTRQPEPLGLGHAIYCAASIVCGEPFAVLLADELIDGEGIPCLQQMMQVWERTGASVVAVQAVDEADVRRYGIVGLDTAGVGDLLKIDSIVEKPLPENAPSNLAAIGRYILMPTIFEALAVLPRSARGEIELTDAISRLLTREAVYAHPLRGDRYDCGNKLGYLKATLHYAMKHVEIGQDFKAYIKHLMKEETLA